MNEMYSYYAFISYKHEDEKWAKWLQKRLENYRLPSALQKKNYPKHLKPIFKDTTDLSPGPLHDSLSDKLAQSRYLIVICSRNLARGSTYVDFELQTFASFGRMDRIIPFIVDGEPHAEDAQNECFSAFMRSLPIELLAADATKDGKRLASLKVIASLLQLNADEIINRDARRRKQHVAAFSCMGVVLAITAGLTVSALLDMTAESAAQQASLYFSQNKYIQAAESAAKSLSVPGHRDETGETAAILRSSVLQEMIRTDNTQFHKVYEIEKYNEGVFLLASSPDGKMAAFCDYSKVWIYDTQTGELLTVFNYNNDREAIEAFLGTQIPEDFLFLNHAGFHADDYVPKNHIVKIEEKSSYDVLKFYDLQNKYETLFLIEEKTAQWCYSQDESIVAVYRGDSYAAYENSFVIYSFDEDVEIPIRIPENKKVQTLQLSPLGKYLFVHCNGYLYVYDVQSGRTVAELYDNDTSMLSPLTFSILPSDPTQIFFYLPQKIEKYTYTDENPMQFGLFFEETDSFRLWDVQISSDGQKAYAVYCGSIKKNGKYEDYMKYVVFDVQSGEEILSQVFDFKKQPIALTPDFAQLICGTSDGIVLYDLNQVKPVFEKTLHSDSVVSVGINEDGRYAVYITKNGAVYALAKTENGYEQRRMDTLQPDDQYVVSTVTGNECLIKTGDSMMRYDIENAELLSSSEYQYYIAQNYYVDRSSLVKSEKYSNGFLLEFEEVFAEAVFSNYETGEVYDFGFLLAPWAYSGKTQLLAGFVYTNQQQINAELTVNRHNGTQLETLYTYIPQTIPKDVLFDNTGTYLIILTEKGGSEVLDAQSGTLLFSTDRQIRICDGVVYDVSDDILLPAALPTVKLGTLSQFIAWSKELGE